jgi:CHAD domain-containing protein
VRTHHEIERTYGPDADTGLPDLATLPGVARVAEPRVDLLEATYFDTVELALVRAGVSLRCRSGGSDEGWHLKIPSGAGREELQLPLGPAVDRPPEELRDAVLGWTRGAPMAAVATIETRRTTYALVDGDDRVLAELADDEVHATRADGETTSWHEWEVELVDGDPDLLEAADALMKEHGVGPSTVDRKIERALGDRVPEPVELRTPRAGKPAARVVHARLAAQVEALARREARARRGDPRGVHKARVACRRLRAALATFRPFLDRDVTEPLRDEIQWLARSLGVARDARVVHERMHTLLQSEPRELVAGPVARRLRTSYGEGARAPEALTDPRYFELRAALDRLVANPPWTEKAYRSAGKALPKRVDKEWKRLRRRYAALADAEGPGERDEAVHDVRKAAKRLRYAAEVAEPVTGKKMRNLTHAAKDLTSYLGERQDTVATREQLVQLARAALDAGEPTFTYGRLHAREEARAVELDTGLEKEWRRLTGPARRSTC